MRATRVLPTSYQQAYRLDLTQDRKIFFVLNLAGVVLLVVAGWLFFQSILWIRSAQPGSGFEGISIGSLPGGLILIAGVLLLTVLNTVIHELIHGVFFWIFTHSRPVFAFHWAYAYAAAPDWFLPWNQYLLTGLAPLVIISLVGLVLVPLLPAHWLISIWFMLTINAAGAVGDVWVAFQLLRMPKTCLAQDRGNSVTLYIEQG